MLKLDTTKAIINQGDPNCQHRLNVQREKDGEIGRCNRCSYAINYSLLHNQLPEMRDGCRVRSFTLERVTKERTGMLQRQIEARKPRQRRRYGERV